MCSIDITIDYWFVDRHLLIRRLRWRQSPAITTLNSTPGRLHSSLLCSCKVLSVFVKWCWLQWPRCCARDDQDSSTITSARRIETEGIQRQQFVLQSVPYIYLLNGMFAVILLNEVDCLTKDAQHALRRTMEKYMSTCRLILCCNSTSKVLPAVRSRCLGVRVAAPTHEEVRRWRFKVSVVWSRCCLCLDLYYIAANL